MDSDVDVHTAKMGCEWHVPKKCFIHTPQTFDHVNIFQRFLQEWKAWTLLFPTVPMKGAEYNKQKSLFHPLAISSAIVYADALVVRAQAESYAFMLTLDVRRS